MNERLTPHPTDNENNPLTGIVAAGEASGLDQSFTRGHTQPDLDILRKPGLREKFRARRARKDWATNEAIAATIQREQAGESTEAAEDGLFQRARRIMSGAKAKANEYLLRLQMFEMPETQEKRWPKRAAIALGVGVVATGMAVALSKGIHITTGGTAQPAHDSLATLSPSPSAGVGGHEHLPLPGPTDHVPVVEPAHAHTEVLGPDDTVWAHAKANLPSGASDQEIYQKSVSIMSANHIPINASGADPLEAARHLSVGTELTIPDELQKH